MDQAASFLEQLIQAGFNPDPHVQYAILSTCGEERTSYWEDKLGVEAEQVLRTAWAYYDRPVGRGGRGGGRGVIAGRRSDTVSVEL